MSEGPEYRWVSNDATGLKLEMPAAWTMSHIDDKTSKITSPDGIFVELRYFTMGRDEAFADEKFLTKQLQGMVKDLSFTGTPMKFMQHGLYGFGARGTGHMAEAQIHWFSVALGDQRGHGVVALGYGPQIPWMTQQQTIIRMMGSVQRS
jgi:hypothetical protein